MLHDDHQRLPRRQPSVDLCAILLAAFRASHLLPRLSPAGLASFLLGASFSMMLGGSMTFLLGFLLFPWVVGLVMLLYLVGLVSSLSGLGRSIICRISPLESQRDVRYGEGSGVFFVSVYSSLFPFGGLLSIAIALIFGWIIRSFLLPLQRNRII